MRQILCICLATLLSLGLVSPGVSAADGGDVYIEPAEAFRTEPMISAGSDHSIT